MIKELIQRWRVRRTFSQFVSKEAMDDILLGRFTENELRKLKESELEFVFVAVKDDGAQQISERMGSVVDLAIEHNGSVDSLISSLVIVIYGMFSNNSEKNRFTLIKALQERFDSDIKIIHGSEKGYYGNLGGKSRLSYSFILPSFLEALKQLSDTNFGEIKEISKAG